MLGAGRHPPTRPRLDPEPQSGGRQEGSVSLWAGREKGGTAGPPGSFPSSSPRRGASPRAEAGAKGRAATDHSDRAEGGHPATGREPTALAPYVLMGEWREPRCFVFFLKQGRHSTSHLTITGCATLRSRPTSWNRELGRCKGRTGRGDADDTLSELQALRKHRLQLT